MAKVSRVRHLKYRCHNEKDGRHEVKSSSRKILSDLKKKSSNLSERKDWEDALCAVCMESPHNAVLLLCSSYNKGCRPYMCATSYRFSNCLDQYKKAYTKATQIPGTNALGADSGWSSDKNEASELMCPLCRGQVKGWTLVKPARKYLNKKRRTCMHENCFFVGNYKQLKKHVKMKHPWAQPWEVDPSLEEKWKTLENEREHNDVLSTFSPDAIVMGDYVLEPSFVPLYINDLLDDELNPFGPSRVGGRVGFSLHRTISRRGYDSYDDDDVRVGVRRRSALARDVGPFSRYRRRMLLFGRPRRRWRQ